MTFALGSSVALAQDSTDSDEDTEEEATELEVVVVVGSRVEQHLDDIAGSVSVMSDTEIKDQMVTDMSQLFQYETGIEITGSNGTAQNFIIRGMGADRVMMVKDGMRMNEGYGANGANDIVGRGFIDVDTVKQVEVAKGASSSLYGADALGGIVAFRTKDPSDLLGRDNRYISLNGDYDGRSNDYGAGILGAFRVGSWESLISYKRRNGNETQNWSNDRSEAHIHSESLLAKMDYIISDDRKLTFSYDYFQQDVDRPDNGEDKGTYVGLPGWTINYRVGHEDKENNSYQLRYLVSNSESKWMDSMDANVYYNDTSQTDEVIVNHDTPKPMGPGGSRTQIKSDLFQQETWGLSLSAAKAFGNENRSHLLSYGFDWDSTDTFRPRKEVRIQSDGDVIMDDLSAPFPKNTTDRLGVYLQDSIEFGDKFTLIPGVRYDHYSMKPKQDDGFDNVIGPGEVSAEKISDDNVSWRLGGIYDITEDVNVYFQYSQGFKVPPYDLAYFYFDHVAFCDWSTFTCYGTRIIPANDLDPEESDSYEIGIRGSAGDFSYNVSAYHSDYSNFIQIAYVDTLDGSYFGLPLLVDVYQYQNIAKANIEGIEARFDYVFNANWSMFLNGEWMDSENEETGDQLPTIQPLNGTLGASYTNGKVSIDGMLKWADDMDKNPEGTLTADSYVTFDVYSRFMINENLSFNVGLLNVFNEEYMKYTRIAGLPEDAGDDRDLSLYTEPGRSVTLRLEYIF
jgi:hemoglobin/transferrin/lactoferrin receptor protein